MTTLFVGNLPDDVKSREIEDIFYKFGRIESVNVRSKGKDTFAFVEFSHESDANEAQRRRDGYQFDSRHRMRVECSRGGKNKETRRDDRDRRDDYGRRDDYDRRDDYSSSKRDDYKRRDDYDSRDKDYGRGYDSWKDNSWNSRNDYSSKPRERRERVGPRLNEKYYKVVVENMPEGISWQDLKDFFKKNGAADVKFTDVKDGQGIAGFEAKDSAERAIEAMNNTAMKNRNDAESTVTMTLREPVIAEEEPRKEDAPMESRDEQEPRDRSRSRGSPRYDE